MAFPFGGKVPTNAIPIYDGKNVTASGTLSAMVGPGVLGDLVVHGGVMTALTIYDNTAASGTVLFTCVTFTGAAATPTVFHVPLNLRCLYGASILTNSATNYYISYTRG